MFSSFPEAKPHDDADIIQAFYEDRVHSKLQALQRGKPPILTHKAFCSATWRDIEAQHRYVQTLFPISTASLQQSGTPWINLDTSAGQKLRAKFSQPRYQTKLKQAFKKFVYFVGYSIDDSSGSIIIKPHTISRQDKTRSVRQRLIDTRGAYDHNLARLTRVMRCLSENGLAHYAHALAQALMQDPQLQGNIPAETIDNHWQPFLKSIIAPSDSPAPSSDSTSSDSTSDETKHATIRQPNSTSVEHQALINALVALIDWALTESLPHSQLSAQVNTLQTIKDRLNLLCANQSRLNLDQLEQLQKCSNKVHATLISTPFRKAVCPNVSEIQFYCFRLREIFTWIGQQLAALFKQAQFDSRLKTSHQATMLAARYLYGYDEATGNMRAPAPTEAPPPLKAK